MKRLVLFVIFVALAFLQGCVLQEMGPDSQDPSENPSGPAHKVSIYSEINQLPSSKVTTDGFCPSDEVGVFIVNYEGETPGELKVEGNQADNVRFTYDENGDWVSDYDVFYKDNETNVDFYGYYPYADPASVDAYPFEVARDQFKESEHGQMAPYEASDFLWAKRAGVKPTSSKVILSFHHMMSAARVRLLQGTGWRDAAEYAAVSKDVLVTSTIRKSTINLATGEVTPEGEAPLTGIVPMEDNDEYRAIVVPQTVKAGKELLVITVDGTPRKYTERTDVQYLPGKITTFDLTISKKEDTGEYLIELAGISITAWEADNMSHSEGAREYVVVHNAVAGRLERTVVDRLEMDPTKVRNLKVTGEINEVDYTFMREKMTNLQRLNLKEVESVLYVDGASTVYGIPYSAFNAKSSLVKCVLPDKLERIEEGAFSGTSLTGTLLLPEGLKCVSGFSETKITRVHFPTTLEKIGQSAFSRCSGLMSEISFPESLKEIGAWAFSDAAITGNLVFPEHIEEIGEGAFSGCRNLTGSLVIPGQITNIKNNTFMATGFSGTLTLPEGIKEIGDYAFNNARFKGELNIPKTVVKIGNCAFGWTNFNGTLVLPPDLISLGSYAFCDCWRLSGVVELPENIIVLPERVFAGCRNIEGIKLHKYVEGIGAYAFDGCYGITSIVCDAKNPPVISADSFNGVGKDNLTVEVPEASVNDYRTANNWSEFRRFAAHRDFSISRNLYRTLNDSYSKTFVLRAPSGESWSVESKPEWVTVSPMSGSGKVEVTVTTSEMEQWTGNRSGQIVFLLDGKEYRSTMTVEQYDYEYGDGDLITLHEASEGDGVNIVLMGDCFDAKDISEGKYMNALNQAYEYFFDIEPYLTYKDYFNVYGIVGMSPDSGMGTVNTIREARFGSQYTLNEGVTPDFDSAFSAACIAPINDDVSRTLIIMVENSSDYSGLCYMWGDGSAVAVVPMSEDPAPYDFRGLIHHEAGGHGFGKLADEYVYHNAFISSCPCVCCPHDREVNAMKSYGFYENISLTGSMYDVPWAHMIFDPQYSNIVDVYEGAFYHSRGVFRSEPTSCMNNNIPYYSAISRETMVKTIMKYAGEEYSYEAFKAKDVESHPYVTSKGANLWYPHEGSASSHRDQMPPKFMGEKPSFKKTDF